MKRLLSRYSDQKIGMLEGMIRMFLDEKEPEGLDHDAKIMRYGMRELAEKTLGWIEEAKE